MSELTDIQSRINDAADKELRAKLEVAAKAFNDAIVCHYEYMSVQDRSGDNVVQKTGSEFIAQITEHAFKSRQQVCRDAASQEFLDRVDGLAAEVDEVRGFLNV